MTESQDLYQDGPGIGARAPILLAHLEGALDAGQAGALAVDQLLRTLSTQRVATFDTDQLIDFRSHRPVMHVDEWVTTDVTYPEIAIDLIHDDQGQPLLLLHGPEPDAKWEGFTRAIQQVADKAGVEAVFSLHGMPAAVPHTRPTTIHVQSTDRDLVPNQPLMGGEAQFPAPYTSYLQYRMHSEGRTGVTLLATVPYYMAGSTFPRASSALLRRLADITGLSLPVGDLERGADEEATQVDQIVEHNRELQGTVAALEQHFDTITSTQSSDSDDAETIVDEVVDWERVMDSELPEGAYPEAEGLGEERFESFADDIGDAIERYLRSRSKQKRRIDASRAATNSGGLPLIDRPEAKDTEVTEGGRHVPRHRAELPSDVSHQNTLLDEDQDQEQGREEA